MKLHIGVGEGVGDGSDLQPQSLTTGFPTDVCRYVWRAQGIHGGGTCRLHWGLPSTSDTKETQRCHAQAWRAVEIDCRFWKTLQVYHDIFQIISARRLASLSGDIQPVCFAKGHPPPSHAEHVGQARVLMFVWQLLALRACCLRLPMSGLLCASTCSVERLCMKTLKTSTCSSLGSVMSNTWKYCCNASSSTNLHCVLCVL